VPVRSEFSDQVWRKPFLSRCAGHVSVTRPSGSWGLRQTEHRRNLCGARHLWKLWQV